MSKLSKLEESLEDSEVGLHDTNVISVGRMCARCVDHKEEISIVATFLSYRGAEVHDSCRSQVKLKNTKT